MKIAAPLTLAALAAGLFVAGSIFVPGTAEAHCGDHNHSCDAFSNSAFSGTHCVGGHIYYDYQDYQGYCIQADSRGAACNNGFCDWGSDHNCLNGDGYSVDMGIADECGGNNVGGGYCGQSCTLEGWCEDGYCGPDFNCVCPS